MRAMAMHRIPPLNVSICYQEVPDGSHLTSCGPWLSPADGFATDGGGRGSLFYCITKRTKPRVDGPFLGRHERHETRGSAPLFTVAQKARNSPLSTPRA